MSTTEVFLLAMLLIFVVPFAIWRLGRTEYYAPLVVVQILCGILLGPGVLGAAFPDYYAFVFDKPVIAALNGIAWWAVMLFVWVAGVELDLGAAWQRRRETGVTAGLALGMPLLFGAAAALVLLGFGSGWIGAGGSPGLNPSSCAIRYMTRRLPWARTRTTWRRVVGTATSCARIATPCRIARRTATA